ncbi:discoidin domain-containing protein [Niabella sp. CC-SYL272]|uniref:discoidin domain-containing protein n=1 Tax=Niabella agricola TaxID=2891571 RepID=UPI001F19041F|nr:discoidin domain-containing protein [Niabella agricola]MCF3111795.1 discoidin domain-containing protein [Niabella agricola]
MKRVHGLLVAILSVSVILVSGCKKYGFNIPDGYNVDSLKTNVTIDTSGKNEDNSFLQHVRMFPGLVEPGEARLQNAQVVLNLNYLKAQRSYLMMYVEPGYSTSRIYSTGMYAPPGGEITITVPAGVTGLSCQVGIWSNTVSGNMRYSRIITRQELFPGVNKIKNLFGGHVYILPSYPVENPVALSFSGTCKSPDFVLGTTAAAAWKQAIQNSGVPWFELASSTMVLTLPVDKMKAYLALHPDFDPVQVMQQWDNMIQTDFNGWAGLTAGSVDPAHRSPQFPWRTALDAQPSYLTGAYPLFALNTDEWMHKLLAVNDETITGVSQSWDMVTALGLLYAQPKWIWSGLFQASVGNLFLFERAKRLNITDMTGFNPQLFNAQVVTEALRFSNDPTINPATNLAKSFDNDSRLNSAIRKTIPFLQIFEKLKSADNTKDGYGFMTYIFKKTRDTPLRIFINDDARKDFLYESLCEYTGLNCIFFFRAWGINISPTKQSEMAAKYPVMLTKNIWQYNPLTKTGGDSTVLNLPGLPFSRALWTVSADSYEPNGEGPPNGWPISAIDGNVGTFWHTQWQGGGPAFPHWFLIDMHEALPVSGMIFTPRQSDCCRNIPKDYKIYIGNTTDEAGMTLAAQGVFQNNNSTQRVNFTTPVTGRFIKLVFASGYSNTYAVMAEIQAF